MENPVPPVPMEVTRVVRPPGNRFVALLIGIFILLAAGMAVFVYFRITVNNFHLATLPPNTISEATPIPSPTPQISSIYLSNYDLYSVSASGTSVPVTRTNASVSVFDVSPNRQTAAYITGDKINVPPFIRGNSVHLLQISDSTDKIIFEHLSSPDSSGTPDNYLTALAFSPNGKLLAITSKDTLYVYSLESAQMRKIYTRISVNRLYPSQITNVSLNPSATQALLKIAE
jgi:hypothetical protein